MDFPPFLCGSLWKSDFAGYQRLVIFEQKNSSLLIWGAKWIVWISWPGESHDLRIRLVAESWSNDKNHDFSIVFCWCGETPRDDFAIYFSIEIIDIYIYTDMISCDITQISFRNWGFCQVAARIHLVHERWWSETTTMWCQERRAAPWAVHSHTGRCENTDVWTWWKSQKKTGTKLVLDVSNDAISIHIYFRPVHEWLLLTNELSSPPKSGEWCHALFVRRDAEPNGANSWSQRPCPETSGAISRRGANCLAQTWNVRNVSGSCNINS